MCVAFATNPPLEFFLYVYAYAMDDESKHSVMRMQSKEDFFPSVQVACFSLLLTPMDLNFDTRYGNPWENGGILMQTYVPHWLPQCCEDCQVDRLRKRKTLQINHLWILMQLLIGHAQELLDRIDKLSDDCNNLRG